LIGKFNLIYLDFGKGKEDNEMEKIGKEMKRKRYC
jgi:hypothetical protein